MRFRYQHEGERFSGWFYVEGISRKAVEFILEVYWEKVRKSVQKHILNIYICFQCTRLALILF